MIQISNSVSIPDSSVTLSPIRSRGPGGQHVNKVATGVQLRFDIKMSGLPEVYTLGLAAMKDSRISDRGIVVIKAHRFKSQEKNRADAMDRLVSLIRSAGYRPKKRRPTRPGRGARERRLASKSRRSQVKSLRGKVNY
jgi:ribosome-associated protein